MPDNQNIDALLNEGKKLLETLRRLTEPRWYQRPALWLTAVPLAAGTAAWFIGGSENWIWMAGIWVVGLILGLMALPILKALVEHEPDGVGHIFKSLFFLNIFLAPLLGLAAWVIVGGLFPLNDVRIMSPDFSIIREHGIPLQAPVRIKYHGKTLQELPKLDTYNLQYRGQIDLARIEIEVQGPDGWQRLPTDPSYGSVSTKLDKAVTVYVDNRNHPEVTLGFGDLRVDVPANSKQVFAIPPAIGKGDVVVTQDGTDVGKMKGDVMFIDGMGNRHYHFQQLVYGGGIGALGGGLDRLRDVLPDDDFEGVHIHRLRAKLDYFLEKAPHSIEVHTMFGWSPDEKRTELVEVE